MAPYGYPQVDDVFVETRVEPRNMVRDQGWMGMGCPQRNVFFYLKNRGIHDTTYTTLGRCLDIQRFFFGLWGCSFVLLLPVCTQGK